MAITVTNETVSLTVQQTPALSASVLDGNGYVLVLQNDPVLNVTISNEPVYLDLQFNQTVYTVVTYQMIQDVSASKRILLRKSTGAGKVEEGTLSELLDFVGSPTQGDILYRNATEWVRLPAGNSGQALVTGGAAANPEWKDVGYATIPQNSQSANYETVAADSGKHILHPESDPNVRTFTIASNATVPYPIGTSITFINETAQVLSIAISADTMILANSTLTGTRSLAQNGIATAIKIGTTRWLISGAGLN